MGKEAADDIEIIANEVEYGADGSWGIKFRHPERYVVSVFSILMMVNVLLMNCFVHLSGFGHG